MIRCGFKMVDDLPKTYGRKGQIIHAQAREIIARVTHFMKNEAAVFQRTGKPVIPLSNFRQRVLAATRISDVTYYNVLKEAADVASGDLPAFPTPRHNKTTNEKLEDHGGVPISLVQPLCIIPQVFIISKVNIEAKKTLFSCSNVIKRDYKCNFCDFSTFFKTDLWRHVGSAHLGESRASETQYRCANCPFTTYSQLVLLKHELNE
ncbi:uncharacterized protein LOC123008903 [Tribolium madens]|uniref:uncharacterized protein LOC123008903 n=1 Tax=Tribolium madens TaxID=41895 RepID=UPI001CF7348D|nr:uncharacterized protein LOC123008903 [Tribolium madens]